VLVALDLVRLVGIDAAALHAFAGIFSQEHRFALRPIAMDRLPHTAVFTGDDEIPRVGFAEC